MHTEVNNSDKYAHLSDCAMHNETKKSIKSLGCKNRENNNQMTYMTKIS
jgi:hypothetical protein